MKQSTKSKIIGIALAISVGFAYPAFSASPQFESPIQALESSQLRHVGNFDGDSYPDLLLLAQDKISYRKGLGNGGFGAAIVSVLGLQLFNSTPTAVGDLTGDSIDDFVFMVPFGKDLQVYKGSAQGVFTLYRSVELDYGVSKPIVGNFNADPYQDILITSTSIWGGNYFIEGTSSGLSVTKTEYKDGFYPNGMRCDISRISKISPTGLPGFLCIGSSSIGIVPMNSATQPAIVNAYTSPYTSNPDDRQYAIAEFSGDGLLDLAALRGNSGSINLLIYENSSFGLNSPRIVKAGVLSWQTQLLTSDIDGDGRSDLVLFNPNGSNFYSLNLGNLSFQPFQLVPMNLSNEVLIFADLNVDGMGDFIFAGNSRISVALVKNVTKIAADAKPTIEADAKTTIDATNEARIAEDSATNAALAAAEAADAATLIAQGASDAVAALSESVNLLITEIQTQIKSLAAIVARLAKK